MIEFNIPGKSVFFGYYDLNPLKSGKHLFTVSQVNNRLPLNGEMAGLGYFDLSSLKYQILDHTRAWNWQQGSRLQWVNEQTVIYNDIIDGKLVGKQHDISKNSTNLLADPIYLGLQDPTQVLSINFSKVTRYREAYGYFTEFNELDPYAIRVFNIKTGLLEYELTHQALMDFSRDQFGSKVSDAYLDHVLQFQNHFLAFLNIVINNEVVTTCLVKYKPHHNQALQLITSGGFVTHHAVTSDNAYYSFWSKPRDMLAPIAEHRYPVHRNQLSIMSKIKSKITTFIRKFLNYLPHGVTSRFKDYPKIHITNGGEINAVINHHLVTGNGHPSIVKASKNRYRMLFDTYGKPSVFGKSYRLLFLTDINFDGGFEINNLKKILSKPSEYDDTGYRCDMHPRWLDHGALFSIDLVKDGCRSIYVGNVPND